MVTIADLKATRPEKLSAVANKLQRRKRAIEALQDEIDGGRPPSDWEDQFGSEAALRLWRTLKDSLNDMAAEVSRTIGELDVAATHFKAAKDDLERWLDIAKKYHYTVTEAGGTVTVTPPAEGADENAASTPADVGNGIEDALGKAAQADADLTAAFNAAARGQVEGGTGSIKSADAAGLSKTLTIPEQVAYAKHHKIPADEIGLISPEAQTELADDVAGDIGSDGHGHITPDTVRAMENLQGAKPFAHELFTKVPPHTFATALQDLNNKAFPYGGDGNNVDKAGQKLYSGFLHAAGAGLATYTNTLDHGQVDSVEKQWSNAIEHGHGAEGAALSLMVKDGGESSRYNTDFIYKLSNDIYGYERDHGGPSVWDRGEPDALGRTPGIIDPDNVQSTSVAMGGSHREPTGMDCLDNVLGGLNHSPEAAQRFFADGYTSDTDTTNSRLDYLLHDRKSEYGAGGDGLGGALEAATVRAHHTDNPADFSNRLTTELFKSVAHHSGEGSGTWTDGWHIPDRMHDSLGAIVSGYPRDTYEALVHEAGGAGGPLPVSQNELKAVLGEIGHGPDKSGAEMVVTSLAREGDVLVAQDMGHHPGMSSAEIQSAIAGQTKTTGQVLGDAIGYSGLVDADDAHREQHQAAIMSKAFDIASGFVPGPGGSLGSALGDAADSAGGHMLQTALDTGTSEGLDALKGAIGSSDSGTDPLTNIGGHSVEDVIQRNLMNNYLRHGALDVPPEFVVKDSSGQPMIDPHIWSSNDIKDIPRLSDNADHLATTWDNLMSGASGHGQMDGVKLHAFQGQQAFDSAYGKAQGVVSRLAEGSHHDRMRWIDEGVS